MLKVLYFCIYFLNKHILTFYFIFVGRSIFFLKKKSHRKLGPKFHQIIKILIYQFSLNVGNRVTIKGGRETRVEITCVGLQSGTESSPFDFLSFTLFVFRLQIWVFWSCTSVWNVWSILSRTLDFKWVSCWILDLDAIGKFLIKSLFLFRKFRRTKRNVSFLLIILIWFLMNERLNKVVILGSTDFWVFISWVVPNNKKIEQCRVLSLFSILAFVAFSQ